MTDWYQKMLNRKKDIDIKSLNDVINETVEKENDLRKKIEVIIENVN